MHDKITILASGDNQRDAVNNAVIYMSDIIDKLGDYYCEEPLEVIGRGSDFDNKLKRLAEARLQLYRALKYAGYNKYLNTYRRMAILLGYLVPGTPFSDSTNYSAKIGSWTRQDMKSNSSNQYYLVTFDYHF